MIRNIYFSRFIPVGVVLAAVLACSFPIFAVETPAPIPVAGNSHTPEPSRTPSATVVPTTNPPEEAAPQPEEQLTPSRTSTATALPPTDPPEEVATQPEVMITPSRTSTNTELPPTTEPAPTTESPVDGGEEDREMAFNLKEELYFAEGGRGDGDSCMDIMPSSEELPAVRWLGRVDYSQSYYRFEDVYGVLCLFGLPFNEQLILTLVDQESGYLSWVDFVAEFDEENGYGSLERLSPPEKVVEGWGVINDDVNVISVKLWFPVGIETGQWYVLVESNTSFAEDVFFVEPPDHPAVGLIPVEGLDPLEPQLDHYPIVPGEQILIQGVQFLPSEQVVFGIYYTSGDEGVLRLVDHRVIEADEDGHFVVAFSLEESAPAGHYRFIAVLDPDAVTDSGAGPFVDVYLAK